MIKRIEVVGLRGIPGVMGGVERHCEELLPKLAALAPDLVIEVVARSPYVPGGKSKFRGVWVKPLYSPKNQSIEAIVSTLLGVLRARWCGASMVHIHAIGPSLLTPLVRALGMKALVTHHGADYDRAKWGKGAKAMLRLGERLAVRFADRLIVVGPSLAKRLAEEFPKEARKIVFIPNGKVSFFDADDGGPVLNELCLEPGRFILAVGRLVPEKGFHVLLDALDHADGQLKLVIAGAADHDSPYSRRLIERAGANVIFAGMRGRSELKTLYQNAALFVLPSFHEGLPIAALEAASFGCPILLSDIEPNRDLGLPPHHYFRAGDAADLGRHLGRNPTDYLADPEWGADYDWNRIAAETLDQYRAVLGGASGR